jgi:hypothetical protein
MLKQSGLIPVYPDNPVHHTELDRQATICHSMQYIHMYPAICMMGLQLLEEYTTKLVK